MLLRAPRALARHGAESTIKSCKYTRKVYFVSYSTTCATRAQTNGVASARPHMRTFHAFFAESFARFDSCFFCILAALALEGFADFLALPAACPDRFSLLWGLVNLAAACLRAEPVALVVVPCGSE